MHLQFALLFFLLAKGFCFLLSDDSVTVTAPVGKIVGMRVSSNVRGKNIQVDRFLGIPYAEAPVGDLRFRKPVPKAHFSSPYNATAFRPFCFQLINNPMYKVSEDCLVLNVYVPASGESQSPTSKYPVMIWIHGGGFTIGWSDVYIADTLSDFGDVIVVTINYRLAALGFLSTGDSDSPGNYGLWDQHQAIKWVNENIEAFGGNKDMVTIFGESAGSSSVIYQALFPGNRGLVHRAIAESGSITSNWGSSRGYKQSARAFADAAGCPQVNFTDAMSCLRAKSSDELFYVNVSYNNPYDMFPWKPVVDGEFVPEDPTMVLGNGSLSASFRSALSEVHLLIGYNNVDGGVDIFYWMGLLGVHDVNKLLPSPEQFKVLLNGITDNFYKVRVPDVVRQAISFEYMPWTDPSNGKRLLNQLINLVTEQSLVVPSIQTLSAHNTNSQNHKNAYLYQFMTRPSTGYLLPIPEWLNEPSTANHADEQLFVFGFNPEMTKRYYKLTGKSPGNLSSSDVQTAEMMMTMWTNFAKTGNPNTPVDIQRYSGTQWPKYDPYNQTYLEISSRMGPGSVKRKPASRAQQFWGQLVPNLWDNTACTRN